MLLQLTVCFSATSSDLTFLFLFVKFQKRLFISLMIKKTYVEMKCDQIIHLPYLPVNCLFKI